MPRSSSNVILGRGIFFFFFQGFLGPVFQASAQGRRGDGFAGDQKQRNDASSLASASAS